MMGQVLAAQIDISGGIGTIDLQEILAGLRQILQNLGIAALAAEIVAAAVLAVQCIPAVGKGNGFPICGEALRCLNHILGKSPRSI